MKVAVVALTIVLAEDARADQLACTSPKDVIARKAKLDAANAKAKADALTAAGLKPLKVTVGSKGNVVTVDVPQSCDVEPWNMIHFAVDKSGKAYRIKPTITTTDVGVFACGTQTCARPCVAPDYDIPMTFKLPDNVVYSGEREVAWKEQRASVSYEVPAVCASGQAKTPAPSTTGTSELEKLKSENAKLRNENAELKKKLEALQAQNRAEADRLQKENKKLNTKLK